MTEQEIKIAMLAALQSKDFEEGLRLRNFRHILIDRQAIKKHRLVDAAFERFWKEPRK
jgi:hypothetical protein